MCAKKCSYFLINLHTHTHLFYRFRTLFLLLQIICLSHHLTIISSLADLTHDVTDANRIIYNLWNRLESTGIDWWRNQPKKIDWNRLESTGADLEPKSTKKKWSVNPILFTTTPLFLFFCIWADPGLEILNFLPSVFFCWFRVIFRSWIVSHIISQP